MAAIKSGQKQVWVFRGTTGGGLQFTAHWRSCKSPTDRSHSTGLPAGTGPLKTQSCLNPLLAHTSNGLEWSLYHSKQRHCWLSTADSADEVPRMSRLSILKASDVYWNLNSINISTDWNIETSQLWRKNNFCLKETQATRCQNACCQLLTKNGLM